MKEDSAAEVQKILCTKHNQPGNALCCEEICEDRILCFNCIRNGHPTHHEKFINISDIFRVPEEYKKELATEETKDFLDQFKTSHKKLEAFTASTQGDKIWLDQLNRLVLTGSEHLKLFEDPIKEYNNKCSALKSRLQIKDSIPIRDTSEFIEMVNYYICLYHNKPAARDQSTAEKILRLQREYMDLTKQLANKRNELNKELFGLTEGKLPKPDAPRFEREKQNVCESEQRKVRKTSTKSKETPKNRRPSLNAKTLAKTTQNMEVEQRERADPAAASSTSLNTKASASKHYSYLSMPKQYSPSAVVVEAEFQPSEIRFQLPQDIQMRQTQPQNIDLLNNYTIRQAQTTQKSDTQTTTVQEVWFQSTATIKKSKKPLPEKRKVPEARVVDFNSHRVDNAAPSNNKSSPTSDKLSRSPAEKSESRTVVPESQSKNSCKPIRKPKVLKKTMTKAEKIASSAQPDVEINDSICSILVVDDSNGSDMVNFQCELEEFVTGGKKREPCTLR